MRCLIAAFLLIGQLAPAEGRAEDLLPSMQSIVDRGSLVIAIVGGSRAPMIMHSEDGSVSGFDVELGEDIAKALGVQSRFVAAGPRNDDVIRMVAAGEADIGLSYLSESVQAGMSVFFSAPYIVEAHTVFFNRVKGREFIDDCPSLADLRRLARTPGGLGIPDLSPYNELAKPGDTGSRPQRFADIESLVAAVEAGAIVASVQGELLAKYFLSRHPQAAIRVGFCYVPKIRHRVAAAVRPDGPDLLRWLDLYIAQRGVIVDHDTLLYRTDRAVY